MPPVRRRDIFQRQVRPTSPRQYPSPNWFHSEDGKLILHDGRAGGRMSAAQGTLQHTTAFTGVQHHPVMEHVLATCDVHGQVCLRDTRMAFGPLSRRSNGGIVRVVCSFLVVSYGLIHEMNDSITRNCRESRRAILAIRRAAVWLLIVMVGFELRVVLCCFIFCLGSKLAVTFLVSLPSPA
jgi:hypothetical protein